MNKEVVRNSLPIDIRELKVIKNNIINKWKGGTGMETMAIEYGIDAFHKYLCENNF